MFEEFGLRMVGHKRVYLENFKERDYNLEFTVPYSIKFRNTYIEEESWGILIQKVANILITESNKNNEELISFSPEWSGQKLFGYTKRTNWKKVTAELYINCNHTALHSCWLLQDLFDFFGYSRDEVELYINRYPVAEPKPIQLYFENAVKTEFKNFLMVEHYYSSEKAEKIVESSFKFLNGVMKEVSKAYYNLFLFDNYKVFEANRSRLLSEMKLRYELSKPKNYELTKILLNLLKDFYKKMNY